jgi:hypothetical protein
MRKGRFKIGSAARRDQIANWAFNSFPLKLNQATSRSMIHRFGKVISAASGHGA